jgi:hypothetical protein
MRVLLAGGRRNFAVRVLMSTSALFESPAI